MNNGMELDAAFGRFQQLLLRAVPKTKQQLIDLTQQSGENWVRTTRANALIDSGAYQRSIHFETVNGGFKALFFADVPYAMYLEFGTGGSVEIPDGFEELAAQYKGKGAKRVNLPAHPNLIPAYLVEREKYKAGIQAALKQIFQ